MAEGKERASTHGKVFYQGPDVPVSIFTTGNVWTARDGKGSDTEFFGVDPVATEVEVLSGRGKDLKLDTNGFQFVDHKWSHVDYYDNQQVLEKYYPEVEALVRACTGATRVVAFDHNIRAKGKKQQGEQLSGGNAVQEPLISYGVHNDYTVTSAPLRIQQLAQPPKLNDTLRPKLGAEPAIHPDEVEGLLKGRWMLLNVWRNITENPVKRYPLGLCDSTTATKDELVTFEIRYQDRVGENYFARHAPKHQWYYFPEATRDEVILLKVWDSRGAGFASMMPGAQENGVSKDGLVPSTFVMHSAFDDPATPEGAPDRESMEVRTAVFFE